MKTKNFLTLAIILTFSQANLCFSQKKIDPAINEIKSDIAVEFTKIEVTLKKDPKLFERLSKEISEANAIEDSVARKAAINKYLSANDAAYGSIVKKAGVDYKVVIETLSKKYPAYKFSVVNKYGIVFERETNNSAIQSYSSTSATTTEDITGFNHSEDEDKDCSAHVSFPKNRSLHVSTSGLSATYSCEATGSMTKTKAISPTNRPVGLNFTYRTDLNGEALGIGGSAVSSSYISVLIQGLPEMYSETYYKSACAPLCTYSSFDDDKVHPIQFSMYQSNSNNSSLYFDISSTSRSTSILCCGTRSRSNVAITKCELIYNH
ncbi:MAG: hypothetical protein IPP86_04450 [Bacteroidetes bacterium]|nr:hypothetical protein [Bacteroidota bacterium]